MTSKTFSTEAAEWTGPRVSHADMAARLAARRKALGGPEAPRNTGERRTGSKRALLQAIRDVGGEW
ncbi:hypothetical protein KY084_12400 [Stakelama sp. CBK3Z-3]|uniref:Uncharacterized protein n=1 Tax=Stakelama flava TaxID=2860338 RepID=A0ABS6XN75_9SPHN|nr:hypothetical protein [Stakelama flava]MBW4331670.1 hypothetical protein [Stakelama flava]